MPKFKVGVYGSAGGKAEIVRARKKARAIGELLAQNNAIVVTGACPGIPLVAASAAKRAGGEVWGFSPMRNRKAHMQNFPDDDQRVYKKFIFVPKTFPFSRNLEVSRKYRNVISTAYVDAGVIIAGRWGTLHEFCSLHDYGKVIGILSKSGGFAELLPAMLKKTSKKSKAKIVVHSDPEKLVALVLKHLKRNR